jgi:hypothetical protein
MEQTKVTARRAFSGLAGSPLAVTQAESPKSNRRGRPRKFASDAARMRHNRAQQKEKAELDPQHWEEVLGDEGLSAGAGMYMPDADHGKGLLITGGYDTDKIHEVVGASERDGKDVDDLSLERGGTGRRVKPKGYGQISDDSYPYQVEDTREQEADERFVKKQEKNFLQNSWKTPPKSEWVLKMFCATHGDRVTGLPLQPAKWNKAIRRFVLECGCSRGLNAE